MPSPLDDIRISALGTYVPAGRASNLDLLPAFGLQEDFLRLKLGIVTRAVKEAGEETSDLCVKALEDLRTQVDISLADVQICCVVTQSPDKNIPHTAAIVHQKLGLSRPCMTFDISQGCAGYVHGIALVTSLMASLKLDHALLFTCDPYSKVVDPQDKNTALIFGDAASASYLCRGRAGYSLVDASFGTEPGSSSCLSLDGEPRGAGLGPTLKMDGAAVLFHATRVIPGSISALLDRHGLTSSDIDRFLLHPGSLRVVDLIKKAMKLPAEKAPFEIEHCGNTVSSSIPLLLKRHVLERDCKRLLLSGFGVGFSFGNGLIELRDGGT